MIDFILKVIFALNELTSVQYLQQPNLTSFINPITLDDNRIRIFYYALIGRECNLTWTIFKKMYLTNSSITDIDTNSNICVQVTYPGSDSTSTNNSGLC